MRLDINAEKVYDLKDKLEKMSSYAFPVSVRSALNNAAFETKKNIPRYAQSEFVTRNKGLFKAFISVNKAEGKDLKNMASAVGVFNAAKSKLASDLSQQEIGGTVPDRSLIPMDQARVSSSNSKSVKKANYLSTINISKSRKKGTGTGYIIIKKGDSGTVFSTKKGSKNKLTPLYSYKKGRRASLKRKPFIQPVALKERQRIAEYFVNSAERMLKKIMK